MCVGGGGGGNRHITHEVNALCGQMMVLMLHEVRERGERSKFRVQTDVSKLCKGLSSSGMLSSAILLSTALLFLVRGEDSPRLSSLRSFSSSASRSSSVPSRNGV